MFLHLFYSSRKQWELKTLQSIHFIIFSHSNPCSMAPSCISSKQSCDNLTKAASAVFRQNRVSNYTSLGKAEDQTRESHPTALSPILQSRKWDLAIKNGTEQSKVGLGESQSHYSRIYSILINTFALVLWRKSWIPRIVPTTSRFSFHTKSTAFGNSATWIWLGQKKVMYDS